MLVPLSLFRGIMADDKQPSWHPPVTINVLVPQNQPRARGLKATTTMQIFHTRLTLEDEAKMKEEADALGLKYQQYARWCILAVTRELRKLRTGEGFTPNM